MGGFSEAPSYELILHHFRSRRGLYLLGAGASAGLVPIGGKLFRIAALDWLRSFSGFSPGIPAHSLLGRRIIEPALGISTFELTGREIRPGTEPYPIEAVLQRLPDNAARVRILIEMAKFRFSGHATNNYRVFSRFHRSLILNYNLDGLVGDQCGKQHRVINAHAIVNPWYGSPSAESIMPAIREFNSPLPADDLILCVPEHHEDEGLKRRLQMTGAFSPDFIAIIGYRFAKVSNQYDDYVSLEWFRNRFINFPGSIYVIDPNPEEMQFEISDRIKSLRVFGVRAYWNILSHAFLLSLNGSCKDKSVYAIHEEILSAHGEGITFPR